MRQGRTLSERINYAMIKQDKSQADIARETGLSTGLVAQIVSGSTKNPRFDNVMKIAQSLRVPLDYLAGHIDYCVIRIDDEK